MSDLGDRLRLLFADDELLTRLRRVIEHEGRVPGWEDEQGSDWCLSLFAHTQARHADEGKAVAE